MVEIRITRELGDFEPKFAGPFTLRQAICLLFGAVPCYFLYMYLRPYMPVDVIGFLCFIPASIAAAFGWFKPYGMKMEIFLRSIFITTFLAPAARKYCGPNRTQVLLEKVVRAEMTALDIAQAEGPKQKKRDKKKEKSHKYKRSPLAYH